MYYNQLTQEIIYTTLKDVWEHLHKENKLLYPKPIPVIYREKPFSLSNRFVITNEKTIDIIFDEEIKNKETKNALKRLKDLKDQHNYGSIEILADNEELADKIKKKLQKEGIAEEADLNPEQIQQAIKLFDEIWEKEIILTAQHIQKITNKIQQKTLETLEFKLKKLESQLSYTKWTPRLIGLGTSLLGIIIITITELSCKSGNRLTRLGEIFQNIGIDFITGGILFILFTLIWENNIKESNLKMARELEKEIQETKIKLEAQSKK